VSFQNGRHEVTLIRKPLVKSTAEPRFQFLQEAKKGTPALRETTISGECFDGFNPVCFVWLLLLLFSATEFNTVGKREKIN